MRNSFPSDLMKYVTELFVTELKTQYGCRIKFIATEPEGVCGRMASTFHLHALRCWWRPRSLLPEARDWNAKWKRTLRGKGRRWGDANVCERELNDRRRGITSRHFSRKENTSSVSAKQKATAEKRGKKKSTKW